jgi:anhydro-N-acetylmuramic acid kinase
LAAGGEGAPLAVYGDYFLFGNENENRIMLNIGGIGNFTYLPKNQDPKLVFVTDTGTGNTLIDAFTKLHYPELSYDKEAQIAQKGQINLRLLEVLKDHPFFKGPYPKTTGPELFNLDYVQKAIVESKTQELSVEDILATLTRFSAETIAEAILFVLKQNETAEDSTVYVSGGGLHNPLLMSYLKELLPCTIKSTSELGISADAKEAILFAILANETVAGGNTNFGSVKGIPSVNMGKISFPD